MARIWLYSIAVVTVLTFIVTLAVLLLVIVGHKRANHCKNDSSRLSHPLIYIPGKNECFLLHTQGPCNEGNWLTIDGLKVSCRPNGCKSRFYEVNGPNAQVVVPLNDNCYKLGERCGSRGELISYGDSGYPQCSVHMSTSAVGNGGRGGACPKGTFRFQMDCLPPTEFELD